MVTTEELKVASEIIYRKILDDDNMWSKIPEDLKASLIDGLIEEIPKLIPESQRAALKAMIALILYEQEEKNEPE